MKNGILLLGVAWLWGVAPVLADDKPAVAISQDASDYPASAGTQYGTVDLSFGIDAAGHVTAPKVIAASLPGVFDQAALATVAAWTYQPRQLNGVPVAQADNLVRLRFVPPDDVEPPTVPGVIKPHYSVAAFRARQEGDVTLSFDVDASGLADHVKVVSATNPGWFDREAISEVSGTLFNPGTVNGVPQEATNNTITLHYRLAQAQLYPTLVYAKAPEYPATAEQDAVEGNALLDLTAAPSGAVASVVVLYSVPSPLFGQAAARAARQWRFAPQAPDLAARMVMDIKMPFSFRFSNSNDIRHYSLKPHQWVRLGYTLRSNGRISDIVVMSTSAPDVDTAAAVYQLRETEEQPIKVGGVAVDAPEQELTITGPSEEDYANSDRK